MMKNSIKKLTVLGTFLLLPFFSNAQMSRTDLEAACSKITTSTHSHFNLVINNNVDKHEMKSDFSLEFKENVMIIHNGLNEIHVAYKGLKYISVGKPDKATGELKGQWYLVF